MKSCELGDCNQSDEPAAFERWQDELQTRKLRCSSIVDQGGH